MKTDLHEFFYKKNILQQIKGFCYAARYSSISEAARSMNLTQSTVTLQIQSLERDLGIQLFKRDSKPLSLTTHGEEFYKLACPLMHEFESVVNKFLDGRKEKEQQKIDIAMHHVAISYMMPRIVANLKKSHPQAKIMIRNIAPGDAVKRLKDGTIDLAFYPNLPREAEIKHFEIIAYDPVLIMNNKHPLSRKVIRSLKDLKEFDLIRIDRNLITLPLFEETVRSYKIKGSVEFENGNWDMLKNFVKENNFVAIVSSMCLDKHDSDLVVKNLSKFFPKMSYSISMRNGEISKPIVQDLFDVVKKVAIELQ